MLRGMKSQIPLHGAIRFVAIAAAGGGDPVRTGELGHHQTASAKVADKSAENRIGHPGHGSEDGGRRNGHRTDAELAGEIHTFSLACKTELARHGITKRN